MKSPGPRDKALIEEIGHVVTSDIRAAGYPREVKGLNAVQVDIILGWTMETFGQPQIAMIPSVSPQGTIRVAIMLPPSRVTGT